MGQSAMLARALQLSEIHNCPAYLIWIPELPKHDPVNGFVCGRYEATIDLNVPKAQYIAIVERMDTQ